MTYIDVIRCSAQIRLKQRLRETAVGFAPRQRCGPTEVATSVERVRTGGKTLPCLLDGV